MRRFNLSISTEPTPVKLETNKQKQQIVSTSTSPKQLPDYKFNRQQTTSWYTFNMWAFDEVVSKEIEDQNTFAIDKYILSPQRGFVVETKQKKSASLSEIYNGLYNQEPVYVKVFNISPKTWNPSMRLLYEKEMYRRLRAIVNNRVRCLQSLTKDKEECNEISKHFVQMKTCIAYSPTNRCYLVTEDTKGLSLQYMMQNQKMSPLSIYNAYFEILYIIYLMGKMDVIHNDMHRGNILVVSDDNHPTKKFKIFDKEYTLRNYPYYLKVFDFDLGSMHGQKRQSRCSQFQNVKNNFLVEVKGNQEIDMCKSKGTCPDNPLSDLYIWYKVLLMSYRKGTSPQMDEFLMRLNEMCPDLKNIVEIGKFTFDTWSGMCQGSNEKNQCIPARQLEGFDVKRIADLYEKTVLKPLYQQQQRIQSSSPQKTNTQQKSSAQKTNTQQKSSVQKTNTQQKLQSASQKTSQYWNKLD